MGAATLLSSHAGHPRPATSDTTKGSQATPADSLKESQLAARSGPSPRRRTSPTNRIETASLEAKAPLDPVGLVAAPPVLVRGDGELRADPGECFCVRSSVRLRLV
jgi:hypothetical protein